MMGSSRLGMLVEWMKMDTMLFWDVRTSSFILLIVQLLVIIYANYASFILLIAQLFVIKNC